MHAKEISRIKEFRQIRKEIRGSDRYLLVGIDVGKENIMHIIKLQTVNPWKGSWCFGIPSVVLRC